MAHRDLWLPTDRDLRDRIEVLDDLALLGITFGPLELTSPPAHRGVALPTSERPWRPMPERHRWLERLLRHRP
jgi:hypothetical protein